MASFDCTYHSDWERTSLRPYVEMLDAHVRGLMQETRAAMLGTYIHIFSELYTSNLEYRWEEQAGLVDGNLFLVSNQISAM